MAYRSQEAAQFNHRSLYAQRDSVFGVNCMFCYTAVQVPYESLLLASTRHGRFVPYRRYINVTEYLRSQFMLICQNSFENAAENLPAKILSSMPVETTSISKFVKRFSIFTK
jgi:hypothetical protein